MEKKIFFQVLLVISFVTPVTGQNNSTGVQTVVPDTVYESFRLFEDEELIEITLRFDLSTYFRTKLKKDYLKANITFHLSETDSINEDIRL